MTKYMYLFRGGDSRRESQSPEEMQAHMQKWGVWMKGLAEKELPEVTVESVLTHPSVKEGYRKFEPIRDWDYIQP